MIPKRRHSQNGFEDRLIEKVSDSHCLVQCGLCAVLDCKIQQELIGSRGVGGRVLAGVGI
jgi:hypothetical protein